MDERWDAAMLVQQESTAAFMAFASHREYLGPVRKLSIYWLVMGAG
jgi:hypothetical protein